MFRLSLMFIALLTAGCVSLDPHYERPAAPCRRPFPARTANQRRWSATGKKVVNDARLKKSGQHRA